jgi:hypothetical protein
MLMSHHREQGMTGLLDLDAGSLGEIAGHLPPRALARFRASHPLVRDAVPVAAQRAARDAAGQRVSRCLERLDDELVGRFTRLLIFVLPWVRAPPEDKGDGDAYRALVDRAEACGMDRPGWSTTEVEFASASERRYVAAWQDGSCSGVLLGSEADYDAVAEFIVDGETWKLTDATSWSNRKSAMVRGRIETAALKALRLAKEYLATIPTAQRRGR